MFSVHSFINLPVDSVSYILSDPESREALIIDPGTECDTRLTDYLDENRLKLKFIFLTHEHFDHILGVNFLRETFPDVLVVSSSKTSDRLSNPKKNLAIFHHQKNLIVEKADILISEGAIEMINLEFEIFSTPGHTDSSVSLKIDNSFFSGDFLLQGSRIVTNLPTGSKKDYQESIEKYGSMLQGMTIYPGHGETYTFGINKR